MPKTKASQAMINPIWEGEKCYIIGGGPSVKHIENLEELLEDKLVIGVNDAYKYSCTDICFFGDKSWYNNHKDRQEFKDFKGTIITNNPSGSQFGPEICFTKRMTTGFSNEPDKIAFNCNSGAAAINLACLLGVSKIYLIGFDMKQDEQGNNNWHENDNLVPARKYRSFISKIENMQKEIIQKFPTVKIYNCNPDSALDVFPKITLEESFDEPTQADDIVDIEFNDNIEDFSVIVNDFKPTILTVLKSGGEYNVSHLTALRKQLNDNLTIDYNFFVLTDLSLSGNEVIPLTENLPGWHSKLELFKHVFYGPVTYLDLDTIITGNIDHIINHDVDKFYGLEDFYRVKHFASGMMQWDGDFTYLWHRLKKSSNIINRMHWKQCWDQRLIAKALLDTNTEWGKLQDLYINQIKSWKKDRQFEKICDTCRILCFHGIPRPWGVDKFNHLYES